MKRMEAEALKTNDPMLKAVRYAVLGKVYHDNPYGIEVDEASLEQGEDASYDQSQRKVNSDRSPGRDSRNAWLSGRATCHRVRSSAAPWRWVG